MRLDSSHPLANLEEGFVLGDAPVKDIAPMSESTVAMLQRLSGDSGVGIGGGNNSGPQYRPLRHVIPPSKGRLQSWKLFDHVRSAKARKWPGVKPSEFLGQTLLICGGGPSIKGFDQLKEIRALVKRGAKIIAINRTHDWLISKGIIPWAGILLDPVPAVATYIKPRKGVRYYIGSQCHPKTLDVFDKPGIDKVLFHAEVPGLEDELTNEERRNWIAATGSTCGLRALYLGYLLGFRETHLFGLDSTFEMNPDGTIAMDGDKPKLHAYHKPEAIFDVREMVIPYPDGQKKYYGNSAMLAQAEEFQEFILARDRGLQMNMMAPHTLYAHGSGAIPDIARFYGLHADQRKKVKDEHRLHA